MIIVQSQKTELSTRTTDRVLSKAFGVKRGDRGHWNVKQIGDSGTLSMKYVPCSHTCAIYTDFRKMIPLPRSGHVYEQ